MINFISTSDFRIKMVLLLKLSVKNENSMKPEQSGLLLQRSRSEHLGYFSTDLFAWLVLFFSLTFSKHQFLLYTFY